MLYLDKLFKWWKKILQWEIPVNSKTKKIFWGIVFVLSLSLTLTIDFIPNEIDLEVGQVSQTDIQAPKTITFIDKEKTQEMKDIAAQSVGRAYEENVNVNKNVEKRIKGFFSSIRNAKEKLRAAAVENNESQQNSQGNLNNIPGINITSAQLVRNIKQQYPEISIKTITTLLEAPLDIINSLENNVVTIIDNLYQDKIFPENTATIRDELAQEAMTLDYNREYRLALANIMESTVEANMIFDEEATRRNRQEARDNVPSVTHTVRQDEMIVRSGDVVTEDDIKILEALGLQKARVNYLSIFGVIIVIVILVILGSIYLYKYKPDIWNTPSKLVFLELMIFIIIFLAKIIDFMPGLNYFYLPYLIPVAISSILITVLIGKDVAVVATTIISFLVALIFNSDYNVALLGFVSGFVGIFSVSKLSQRNDLVRAGFNVSAVLLALVIGLRLISPIASWWNVLGRASMAISNGVIVAILANGLLPYLENLFGLTSSVKLLELSNPSQPLLSKMVFEAPGTYNHCLVVANLAETAANNIGADSLLARVGSYYHDIGKMKRPYFFIENHMGRDNPHDKLSPNLSALIIKSHVKDGVELAKEYRLPSQIIDIIKQHHGTNLISFFYQQALEDSKYDSVEESDFRYDGPKPQTKE
ncbi:MAG: HD family phosphohydrolase, partial [Bacillota bacterium]